MNAESRLSYSDILPSQYRTADRLVERYDTLRSPECMSAPPRILAFMGASGSGKDVALEILTSLHGRRAISRKLELKNPVSVRIVPKVTDRAPRIEETSKYPVTPEEYDELEQSGKLFAPYVLFSNGSRYAYRLEDFTPSCNDDFLAAEPSILHVLTLKEKFGDLMHTTFLASSREYREKLLIKRAIETPEEIVRRLDEGDGQTYIALMLAGKPPEFISQFVSPEITELFRSLLESDPDTWETGPEAVRLAGRVGPEIVRLLKDAVGQKGKVVDELINIDRFRTFIDDIVVLEDKFITDNPYEAGLFSESVIDTATRMLLNSWQREFSVDQTADANVVCNLIIPEAARSEDSVFGIPYRKIHAAVVKNQSDRVLQLEGEAKESSGHVRWISYYDDRLQVFGLIVRDPKNPESVMSFRATRPEDSTEALLEFQIELAPVQRAGDRYVTQMAFVANALKLCKQLGVKTFHYAEHFDLVDENDTVIGLIPRTVAHEDGRYFHRAASVMAWRWHTDEESGTRKKQIFLIKRSANRKLNPGVYQAPSGHLLPGETYAEAARRQLQEEAGVDVPSIKPALPVRITPEHEYEPNAQREHFYFFTAHADDSVSELFIPNYEAESAAWEDVDRVRDLVNERPEDFRDAFRTAFLAVNWETLEP